MLVWLYTAAAAAHTEAEMGGGAADRQCAL